MKAPMCIQVGPPGARHMELVDQHDAKAFRDLIRTVSRAQDVERLREYCLLVSAEEAVANALAHGVPPVTAGVWADGDNLIKVVVHDHGCEPFRPGPGLTRLGALVDHVHIDSVFGTAVSLSQHCRADTT